MPVRTANNSITVMRDGQHVRVRSGTTFDFTEDEIAHIKAREPDALRRPINEMRDVTAADVEKINAPMRADPQAPAVRGRRPAVVKDDDEL